MNKIDFTKKALNELYEKYKNQGILAMYMWGSILTDDFNPETSDQDTIAIVDDQFPLELEKQMMDEIRAIYNELSQFYIRVLYVGELNGEFTKAPLATVIYPPLLLLEMPKWMHVAGENFSNQDFVIKPPTYIEAIQLHLLKLKNDKWMYVSGVTENIHMFFIKTLMRLVDIVQRSRHDTEDLFSYGKILREAKISGTPEEKAVVGAMFESRKNNWDYNIFLKNKKNYQDFIDLVSMH